ncbi:Glu/Leu/Phe/Val dehydrogenase dimerization domain-containing protein [Halomonas sp. HP20-15]|uniref:Glu/Leu/Phe/Val family dehydrogenase n=1 Tax=Halomonas sp. HP20-15 TaxID=3085901 RepID=UPI0029821C5B|nr:Glu/Leu/Phe/Val dehydrogenase dimerization domain-containing protein [Halomonas sp. HP20-15]MDW5375560.1 Glu/Leu/Phe/Val dehydrogenase dimerization domain-containing protein [Halomonas sp. HP20-15]
MSIFDHAEFSDHEQVIFANDPVSGLKAIIAIHNSYRGPALGGLHIHSYRNDAQALGEALKSSRGMTYKTALANLPHGGGKAVVIADPRYDKTPSLLEAMGRLIDSLDGRYITAEDQGSDAADMQALARVTPHVVGLRNPAGAGGDPSPYTAWGVFNAMRGAVRHTLGKTELCGLRVAIQGVGHVGARLARYLHEAGARLVLSDVDSHAVNSLARHLDARVVAPKTIFDVEADIFAPCAMGAVLNAEVCRRLQARIVVGAANDQLAEPACAEQLLARGIVYVPDYVANAGGVIEVAWRRRADYDRRQVMAHIAGIESTLETILERAGREGLSPVAIADRLAEERFAEPRGKASV